MVFDRTFDRTLFGRRRFFAVAASSALAAHAAASNSGVFAAGTGKRVGLKKSLKFSMVAAPGSLEEKFLLLRNLGFDGVELDSPSDLDPAEVLAAKSTSGLEIPGVIDSKHWHEPLSHPDPAVRAAGVRALETALHDCKRFGGTTVLLVPAIVNDTVSYADAYDRSQAEIRRVLPLAQELGVKIAIENVWNNFLLSPLEAARYIDEFESPAIGWYFDVGNIVNYGYPEQWIRTLGKRILKLDVKEFSRKKRDAEGLWKGFNVPLGEGDCNWPEVRKALADIGYQGWASAEVGGGDAERLREISERMDRILKD